MKQWSSARIGDLLYCIRWYCEQGEKEHIRTEGDSFDIHALVRMLREQALDWQIYLRIFHLPGPQVIIITGIRSTAIFHVRITMTP
mgnify:CR=1 FL=1